MPQTNYQLSIATDFGGSFNQDRWKSEVQESLIKISLGPQQVVVAGDVVNTWFADALDAGDQTIFQGLPALHDSSPIIEGAPVTIYTGKGDAVPSLSDGRVIFSPSRLAKGLDPYICGAGDKVTSPTSKGGGSRFLAHWSTSPGTADTKSVSYQFIDPIWVVAGGMSWKGGLAASDTDCDSINMWIGGPPSVVTPNGTNTGNANKVDIGGGSNIIVPANGDGAWDVNLTPTLHSDSPVPIPNETKTGNWDWDGAETGLGEFFPNFAGTGAFDFFDFDVGKLVHWVRHIPVIGDNHAYIDPNSIDRLIMPQWLWHTDIYNHGHADLTVSFYLNLARKKTF